LVILQVPAFYIPHSGIECGKSKADLQLMVSAQSPITLALLNEGRSHRFNFCNIIFCCCPKRPGVRHRHPPRLRPARKFYVTKITRDLKLKPAADRSRASSIKTAPPGAKAPFELPV
jgi:hypothetical protein